MREPHSQAAHLFGTRVRAARLALGLSQEKVAELAQIHVTNFGKIERGLCNPSFLTLVRIASVLGTDVAALAEGIAGHHLPEQYRVHGAQEFVQEQERRRPRI
jgi:transcriptional regulator with XRE-family HTH domain